MADLHFSERKSRELKERSSSARNIKVTRQQRNNEYFGNSGKTDNIMTATKQSKQYPKVEYDLSNQKSHSKNLNQNNDYIKNLYKKYLGKQNSDRKQKDTHKISKNLFKDEHRDNHNLPKTLSDNYTLINPSLTQQSLRENHKKQSQEVPYYNSKYSLTKNKSIISLQIAKQPKIQKTKEQPISFYSKLMDQNLLQAAGNPRSSIVRCLKTICQAKRIIANIK